MAINKKKNVAIMVTFPKEDAKNLDVLVDSFNKEGHPTTRSKVLVHALRQYIKLMIAVTQVDKKQKAEKVADPQGDKKDA